MFMYGIARSLSLALVSAQLFYSVESIAAKLHVWKHSPSHTINLISSLHSSCFGEVFLYWHHVLEVLMHVFIGFYSFSNGLIIRWDAQVNKAVWFTCTNCCIQFCSSTHNMQTGVCNAISVGFFCFVWGCHAPLVEFMYLVFIHMPGKCYHRRLRSLLLCLCEVFQALINSFMGLVVVFIVFVVVGCVFCCFGVVVRFGVFLWVFFLIALWKLGFSNTPLFYFGGLNFGKYFFHEQRNMIADFKPVIVLWYFCYWPNEHLPKY